MNLQYLKNIYEKYTYKCNQLFPKNSLWWYLPTSSRERIGSYIQDRFVNAFLSIKINYPKRVGIRKYLDLFPVIKALIWLLLDNIFILKFLISKPRPILEKSDILFIHPIHSLQTRKVNGKIWNHYFGILPETFISLGFKINISGPVDKDIIFEKRILNDKDYKISNPLLFLTILDLFKIYFRIIMFYLTMPTLPKAIGKEEEILKELIQKESKRKLQNLFWGSVYKYSISRIIKSQEPKYVFHTYENNWWERAVNQACEENKSIIKKQIGYLHCAILESHMKYTLLFNEWNIKPSPDEILVTGSIAKDMIQKRGNYSIDKILVGYDLRGPNLYSINKRKIRPKSIKKILVLLEGLDTMPALLKLILETIPLDLYELSVRCHPVFPIQKREFNEIRNHSLYFQLKVSDDATLDEDLSNADLVIYKGSTSALYAAYNGIPLLRYKDDWWASDDPLLGSDSLKKEFSNSKELLEGIQYFKDIDHQQFCNEQRKMQDYVFNYMHPYKESELNLLAQVLIS